MAQKIPVHTSDQNPLQSKNDDCVDFLGILFVEVDGLGYGKVLQYFCLESCVFIQLAER